MPNTLTLPIPVLVVDVVLAAVSCDADVPVVSDPWLPWVARLLVDNPRDGTLVVDSNTFAGSLLGVKLVVCLCLYTKYVGCESVSCTSFTAVTVTKTHMVLLVAPFRQSTVVDKKEGDVKVMLLPPCWLGKYRQLTLNFVIGQCVMKTGTNHRTKTIGGLVSIIVASITIGVGGGTPTDMIQ